MDELKCPHCGATLEEDDCYDHAMYFDHTVKYLCGHCPDCGKEYQWKELYKFTQYDNLEEV